ncbi:MAG TPA: outer membrane protein assembly factor BamE [Chthoniobacterales bacterium]|jgi:outer membrane protein assembly factor BamE (lipoprotein component of BamABCDE complex)
MRSIRLIVLLLAFAIAGCQAKRLTKANVDQVSIGMPRKEVESILGLPTTNETKEFGRLRLTTYVYKQTNGTVTISFQDDKVDTKESTITQ